LFNSILDFRIFLVWGRSRHPSHSSAGDRESASRPFRKGARENQKIQAAGRHLESVDMDSQHLAAHADFAKDGEKMGVNLRIESMKNANKARMPSKAKAPTTQKGKRQVNPILDMLKNMDDLDVGSLTLTGPFAETAHSIHAKISEMQAKG
jgi:hypothetical protein